MIPAVISAARRARLRLLRGADMLQHYHDGRHEDAKARTSPPKRPSSQSGLLSRRRRLRRAHDLHCEVSTDEEGRVVGEGDLAAQTRQVMHNIGLALKAADASYANIVKIVTFVVGYKPELRPIIGQARSAFFEGMTPPASTLVGVSALAAPEWLIEIEAVAVVD